MTISTNDFNTAKDALRKRVEQAVNTINGTATDATWTRTLVGYLAEEADAVLTYLDENYPSNSAYAEILNVCDGEINTNRECSDVHTPADIAADVVRKLTRDYLGGES